MKNVLSRVSGAAVVALTLGASAASAGANGELDYGLYWYDDSGNNVKAVSEDGSVNRVKRDFYDPNKPTVIHFHGWQPVSALRGGERESFHYTYLGNDVHTNASWKEKGWNTAYFHWDQFADELEVKHAEAKMWTPDGPRGMRYTKDNTFYSTTFSPNKSVGQIAFEHVSAALADNKSDYVRLSGHSLGNQLATIVAGKISDAVQAGSLDENVLVDRLELLDPFWSKWGKDYLGDANGDGYSDWTGERSLQTVKKLIDRHNTPVTAYLSSNINDLYVGDKNLPLHELVATQGVRFWYLADEVNKHNQVVPHYYRTMASDAPEEVTIGWWNRRNATGNVAAGASTDDSRILEMMGDDHEWDQVEGRYTSDPADDQFEIK